MLRRHRGSAALHWGDFGALACPPSTSGIETKPCHCPVPSLMHRMLMRSRFAVGRDSLLRSVTGMCESARGRSARHGRH